MKLGSDPPTETGRWGAMFLNDDILKQWLLGPRGKTLPGCKMASGWEKSYIAKEQRKNL